MFSLPVGTVSSSQDPLVGNDGTTAEPALGAGAKAKSHLVGELASYSGLAIGDATVNRGHVTKMHWGTLWQNAGGDGGNSQNQYYKNLHVDRMSINE